MDELLRRKDKISNSAMINVCEQLGETITESFLHEVCDHISDDIGPQDALKLVKSFCQCYCAESLPWVQSLLRQLDV
jgi:hypothetical protein